MYEILENFKAVLTRPEIQYAMQNFMRNVENVLKLWTQCLWRVNIQVVDVNWRSRKEKASRWRSKECLNRKWKCLHEQPAEEADNFLWLWKPEPLNLGALNICCIQTWNYLGDFPLTILVVCVCFCWIYIIGSLILANLFQSNKQHADI